MRIIVLMSTFNGEKFIRDQLDSLLNQTLKPEKIVVRDDGSTDNTVKILQEYSERYGFLHYYCGKNFGPARSFWELINNNSDSDYYALCDQDDVWFPDKLETAVNRLESERKDIPLLYCSRFTLTDSDLNPINSNVSRLYGFSDFAHSLIYHTAPGCTFVFNEQARKTVARYDLDKEYYLIHDAIIHKVAAMFGKVIVDNEPHIYYRQHGDNEIGMNADTIKVFLGRVKRFAGGKIKCYRSKTARSLLNVYGEDVSRENKELLNIVAFYQKDFRLKKELLFRECFRSGTINDFFFFFLVLVNYI